TSRRWYRRSQTHVYAARVSRTLHRTRRAEADREPRPLRRLHAARARNRHREDARRILAAVQAQRVRPLRPTARLSRQRLERLLREEAGVAASRLPDA